MWPLKRKSKSNEDIGTPLENPKVIGDEMAQLFQRAVREFGEEKAVELFIFERCNFKLARDEIADFFKIADAEAERSGGSLIYKKEFVQGWSAFSTNPCADTARAWLHAAPDYKNMIHSYLIECCPGGKFAFYDPMKC
jgi:hypothetical protein